MLMRLSALLPLALAIIAFVLSFLLLFAGHEEGFLEQYDLIRLNTSTLGYDLVSLSDDESDEDRGGIGGFINDLADDAEDFINDIGNNIADQLADELGISEWYSVHLMTLCRGDFEPNATHPSPDLNVTSCTASSPSNRVNLTEIIDNELRLGPLGISLADINWPDNVDEAIEIVNQVLLAIFILYTIAIGFTGLAIFSSIAAIILDPARPMMKIINSVLVGLATVVLLAASIGVTVGTRIGADRINREGEVIGLSASSGEDFIVLSWVAFSAIAASMVYWIAVICVARREKKRTAYPEKTWRN